MNDMTYMKETNARLTRIESKVSALMEYHGLNMHGEPVQEQFVVLKTEGNCTEVEGPYTYTKAYTLCMENPSWGMAPFKRGAS